MNTKTVYVPKESFPSFRKDVVALASRYAWQMNTSDLDVEGDYFIGHPWVSLGPRFIHIFGKPKDERMVEVVVEFDSIPREQSFLEKIAEVASRTKQCGTVLI